MALKRKPFQGVINIIRFNSHFYIVAAAILVVLMLLKNQSPPLIQNWIVIGASILLFVIVASLLVSFYIYDCSDLYELKWLEHSDKNKILTINAGFDETSAIIQSKFPNAHLLVCDFYDPNKHREISIKRARQIYSPLPGTISVTTSLLPFADNSFDASIAILSAHEIRDTNERVLFFKELNRITSPTGQIFVTEHLRDINNFLAYTIGFFHFHARKSWMQTFSRANLTITSEIKTTPFITTFILVNNGTTS